MSAFLTVEEEVEISLLKSSMERFFAAPLAYVGALVAYLWTARNSLLQPGHSLLNWGLMLILFSVFGRLPFRAWIAAKTPEFWVERTHIIKRWFLGLALACAISWCIFTVGVMSLVAPGDPDVSNLYLILACIGMVAGPTYATYPRFWLIFLLFAVVAPVSSLVVLRGREYFSDTAIIIIFAVICYKMGLMAAGQLRKLQIEKSFNLRRSEHLQKLIDSIPSLVSVFDHELRYSLINQRVRDFVGPKSDQLLGKELGALGDQSFYKMILDFKNSPQLHVQARQRLNGLDGSKWFLVSLSKVSKYNEIVVVSVDIDLQVSAEEEADRQRQAAESAARFAMIGELAGGVAHEINNPLTIILAKSDQALRKKPEQFVDLQLDVEKIKVTAMRIVKIVRGLKNLSRNSDGDPFEWTTVEGILQDVYGLLEERIRREGIAVKLIHGGDIRLQCRPTQLSQVLINLVTNSIDAIRGTENPTITLSCKHLEDSIVFEVEDSGEPISKEIRAKIMVPFFTTKPIGVGTGLGLNICRRIIRDHNGEFFLADDLHKNLFVVRLPIVQDKKSQVISD